MDLFTFDTVGDENLLNKESIEVSRKSSVYGLEFSKRNISQNSIEKQSDNSKKQAENEDDEAQDYGGLPPPSKDISHIIDKALKRSSLDIDKNNDRKIKSKFSFDSLELTGRKRSKLPEIDIDKSLIETKIDKELNDSKLKGIEKEHAIECLSNRKTKEVRKQERLKTKGKDWFNMPATEKTEEIENDLKILQMRSALNPKHFYKKNDLKVLPKYFQIGTVQHSPLEYYNEKDTRRNKKHTIVDELMADAEFQKYNKRKYKEIMERNQKIGYNKALKKMKKLKKKK